MLGRYRYAYLLVTLALLIVGRPFLPDLGRGLLLTMLVLSLATAALANARNRYQVWFGIGMTGIILIASLLPDDKGEVNMAILSPAIGVVYWGFTGYLIVSRIFHHTSRVTVDTINGAICVYLVMGIAWAQAYALLAAVQPGSFSFNGEILATGALSFDRFIGFSFVTLTTTGYGNIVPLSPRADALAIAEAIAGQLYLAVLLARLVAMEIAHRQQD